MENNVYQIKGLRLNVSKDGGVEFNVDEINIPQEVCFKQLELLGTIIKKSKACFMEMKPAIMTAIGNDIANRKRAQDREDRRLKEDIKAKDIKIKELTARICALIEKNNSSK